MKIYTKTGDKGMTSLADGQRVSKCCERLEAYGTVDELNSQLGLLMTYCGEQDNKFLTEVQRNLFIVGGCLAGAEIDKPLSTESMEAEIDRLTAIVEEAQEDKRFHFILPGGSRAAAVDSDDSVHHLFGQCHCFPRIGEHPLYQFKIFTADIFGRAKSAGAFSEQQGRIRHHTHDRTVFFQSGTDIADRDTCGDGDDHGAFRNSVFDVRQYLRVVLRFHGKHDDV